MNESGVKHHNPKYNPTCKTKINSLNSCDSSTVESQLQVNLVYYIDCCTMLHNNNTISDTEIEQCFLIK